MYSWIWSGGGLNFLIFPRGGAQHLLGPENPLKSIDFTGPAPPEYAPDIDFVLTLFEEIMLLKVWVICRQDNKVKPQAIQKKLCMFKDCSIKNLSLILLKK